MHNDGSQAATGYLIIYQRERRAGGATGLRRYREPRRNDLSRANLVTVSHDGDQRLATHLLLATHEPMANVWKRSGGR